MAHDASGTRVWRTVVVCTAAMAAFAAAAVFGTLVAGAQARVVLPAASLPAFDVISVRANETPGPPGRGGGGMQPARYTAQNVSVRNVLKTAYGSDRFPLFDPQIVGGPDWLATAKFDIEATTSGPTDRSRMQQMVQRLLAERFKLVARFETRELPVYLLVKARADGRLGDGLTPTSDEECRAAAADAQPRPPNAPPGTGLPGSPGAPRPGCGAVQFGPGVLIARGTSMEMFAQSLSNVPVVTGLDRMVVDRTGLVGNYGFTMKFSPATGTAALGQGAAGADERPSLVTALQEQLGLKLEATRTPIDVVVVDSAETAEQN